MQLAYVRLYEKCDLAGSHVHALLYVRTYVRMYVPFFFLGGALDTVLPVRTRRQLLSELENWPLPPLTR